MNEAIYLALNCNASEALNKLQTMWKSGGITRFMSLEIFEFPILKERK